MRNIFDQYSQPENRLTHSLASVLHEDRILLRSFLSEFGPGNAPSIDRLIVVEQSLPGSPAPAEEESVQKGLPDAVIYCEDGWALAIESKVQDRLTRDQLIRHQRTIERCGFDRFSGIAITVDDPRIGADGWRMITWRDVYSWASQQKPSSSWARMLVEYFNIAESKMANEGYLREGTITKFSGISFDPYTYLEGKRVLRLLTEKLRSNREFIDSMRLDRNSVRASITNQERLWDFISFLPSDSSSIAFQKYPHCTVALCEDVAEAMITFPHGMSGQLRKSLHGESFDTFVSRLSLTNERLVETLQGVKAYRPMIRVMQRRYKTQRSIPMMDGKLEFDLRTIGGEPKPSFGPPIKKQSEWAHVAYELMINKQSNVQLQIGVEFYFDQFDELAREDADQIFVDAFQALRPFAAPILD